MNIISQIFYLVVLFLFVINSAIGVNSSFSNGLFKISWESEEGKIYSLVNSTNLINDSFSTTLNDDIQATPPQNDYQVNTDNEVGFYKNVKDLGNKIEYLLKYPKKINEYGKRGKEKYFKLFNNNCV